jgi:hypothetical protein
VPYVNKPRPYAKEYQQQQARGENPDRAERQRARRALDAKGVDRKGKDISHVKALSRGGSNADGITLQPPSENRSFKRTAKKSVANPIDAPRNKKRLKV